MATLDLEFVRAQFPAFSEPSLEGFAHFENAGGSYACGAAIDWLDRFYRQTKVQPYYAFAPSRTAGEQMDAAKTRLAAWLNVFLFLGALTWIRIAVGVLALGAGAWYLAEFWRNPEAV